MGATTKKKNAGLLASVAKSGRAAEREDLNEAVLWHAVERAAKKRGNRARLSAATHDVRIEIAAHIDEHFIARELNGKLTVQPDQHDVTASAEPDTAQLIAVLLESMPKTKARLLLANLPKEFLGNGKRLPEVSAETKDAAELLLQQLRTSKTIPSKKGAVSFSPTS